MSNTIATTSTFLALANKKGKVSATSEKVAHALNSMSQAGLQSAAVYGKGSIKEQAIKSLLPQARNVESMLQDSRPDFGAILAQLIAEHGVADYNRATMRGRAGVGLFIAALQTSANVRFNRAETAKAQDGAIKIIQALESLAVAFENAQRVYDAARMAVEQAKALEAASTEAPEAPEASEAPEAPEASEASA